MSSLSEYRAGQGLLISRTVEVFISPQNSIFLFVYDDGTCQVTLTLLQAGWSKNFTHLSHGLYELVYLQHYAKTVYIASLIKRGYHKWFSSGVVPKTP